MTRSALRYQKRKANGVCGFCGKVPPIANRFFCQLCLDKVNIANRAHKKRLLEQGLCKDCGVNKKRPNVGTCLDCSSKYKKQRKQDYALLYKEVLSHYGNCCACCKEAGKLFLTIDHVNNDGNVQRKLLGGRATGGSLYLAIIKADFPKDLQILCYNCNFGKHRNGGVCPHKS